MRISNDTEPGEGGFAELLRLQADFQARLTEEALRYLRGLQGVLQPHAPGTVVQPMGDATLAASLRPGATITLEVEVENRQRVHTVVAPSLTPLVSDTGVTWFADAATSPSYRLLAPGETLTLMLSVVGAEGLPSGHYRGLLALPGFGGGGVPVVVDVSGDKAEVAEVAEVVPS